METADVEGARKPAGNPILPPPMPWIRDPVKGKRAAPTAVPTVVLLEEDPDAVLAGLLQ